MRMKSKRNTLRKQHGRLVVYPAFAIIAVIGIVMLATAIANSNIRETLAQVEAVQKAGGWTRFDCLRRPKWVRSLCCCFAGQVHLPSTKVDDAWIATQLRSTRELFYLDVSDTQVSDLAKSGIELMTGLRVLDLSGSRVTDAGLTTLHKNKQLRTLLLSDTDVSDAGLKQLGGLSELRILRLDNTHITDACINDIAECANVRIISLRGTALSDAALPALGRLTALVQLDVRDTGITRAGVTGFVRTNGYVFSNDLSMDLHSRSVALSRQKPIHILFDSDDKVVDE